MAEAAITRPAAGSSLLPRAISEMIFEDARADSAVMRLARRVPLPFAGVAVPFISGTVAAGWVAEGGRKPVSDATVGNLTIDPKKLSVIVPFSIEYLRSDTIDLLDELRPAIAEAFAVAFDAAALHGTSTPFTAYLAQTTNTREMGTAAAAAGGVYTDLVEGMRLVVADGYRVRGFAFSDLAELDLIGAIGTDGRPLLVDVGDGAIGQRLLGRPVVFHEGVGLTTVRGFGGDFSKAAWGAVGEIEYDVSEEATLTLTDASTINLWQDNMVALRAEAWYGWAVRDLNAFVRYDNAV